MGFVSVCAAIYDYQPQGAGELEIQEGELLYIIEKSTEDDWWRAKKKAAGEDDDEPEGLIPNNYVQEARPTHTARALYDYTRQTDEEVSFTEDTVLDVYDISDPDWTLVGLNGDFGFAPANYIEIVEATSRSPSLSSSKPKPPISTEHATKSVPVSPDESSQTPAANLARVMGAAAPVTSSQAIPSPTRRQLPPQSQHQEYTPDISESEESVPALPQRPRSQAISPQIIQDSSHQDEEPPGVLPSPPHNRAAVRSEREDLQLQSPGGYHLYNISEMVSAMGRRRKLPTVLGINVATGTIMLSPEKSRDGASQEWTADKMTHYSIEGKHVFIELIRPSKSLDLHAGAKDTAEEIVSALGEIAGAIRAEGLKEVIAASSGSGAQKKGQVLYDFMAQGEDEVTVAVGDDVIVLDDTKSEEWWNVRRLKNGKEGVMPSSYIEITGSISIDTPSRTGINAGRSTVDQNRLEEERLAKEAARTNRARDEAESTRTREVGPGMQLPQRGSSLGDEITRKSGRKERRSSRVESKARSKPDPSKTRTWTDHSGTFKVEAQFVGVADGKIQLHKVNGVKIAVPVTKMSANDLEYVEKVTNESIEEHIPVADLIKMRRNGEGSETAKTRSGASVDPNAPGQNKTPDYDWFDFFLKAGVGVHQCERYSQAMIRDSMDESVLTEVTTDTLRTLGLKEGDALKVMKYLDQKFARSRAQNGSGAENPSGGIFSGPGGALHNNTGRLRPEAHRQTSDVVDSGTFEQRNGSAKPPSQNTTTPLTKAPAREPRDGFEDDAWTVKPRKESATPVSPSNASTSLKAPTGALADLSLLDKPLEPTPAHPRQPEPQQQSVTITPAPAPAVSSQPTGANPTFFSQLGQRQDHSAQPSQLQNTGFQQSQQLNVPRQRPQAPQQSLPGGGLLPPPPRPTSAPQNPQHNQFGLQPLQPQLTGVPQTSARQAPPGQSLDELTAQRIQQQFNQYQMQPQPTGYPQQNPGYGQYPNGIAIQQTGYQGQPQLGFQQPHLNGNLAGSPFADPRPSFQPQPTGYGGYQNPSPGGVNSILPPALQPQQTGFGPSPLQPPTNGLTQAFQPAQTGFQQPPPLQQQMTGYQQFLQPQSTGFGQTPQQNGFANLQIPPVPPLPPQQTVAPLQPQKTGPAPQVKFGVPEAAKKLTPQPTGRRANLAQATAQNPFGF